MQNHKLKISLLGVAALIAVSATAQVGAPSAAASASASMVQSPAAQAPTAGVEQPLVLQFRADGGSSNLDEITRLKFEKAKLEIKKEIAQLRADIEEAETGKRPGATSLAEAVSIGAAQAPVGPSPQQILYESVTLLSVYGNEGNLTAEIGSARGRAIGRVGTVLPTGETVAVITPDYVIVTQGKKSRRLNPSTEDAMAYAERNAASAPTPSSDLPGAFDPTAALKSFNPMDLIDKDKISTGSGLMIPRLNEGKKEVKPAVGL